MVLSLASECGVTVRFGRFCIVNFLQRATDLLGCVRSHSRCRCSGDGVFRAGWTVNQGESTGRWRRARVLSGNAQPLSSLLRFSGSARSGSAVDGSLDSVAVRCGGTPNVTSTFSNTLVRSALALAV